MTDRRIASVALWISFSVVFALSQDRGGITGTITDSSGAAVSEAQVKVTNTARGEALVVKTTAAGLFTAANLIPGLYSVSVEHAGFRTSQVTGVEVKIGEVARTDIQLQVGAITDQVEVTTQAVLLKSDTSDIGTTVETEAILSLPLQVGGAVRDPLAFARLTPGFTGATANSAIEFQTHYSINGGQSGGTQILVDGADITHTAPQSQFNTGISVEGVEEFKVMSSSYSAEYGRSTGGIINLILKSGTNSFHGSVYEFLRNDKFDARGFFNAERQVNRQNDFGGLVSGPVRIPKLYNGRDRTFFMFTYEGFRYAQGALNTINTFPIEAFRQGDFSSLVDAAGRPIPIYDPATTVVRPDGTVSRQQFEGNVIPANRIDPVAKNVLKFVPPPGFPDRIRNNIFATQQFAVDTNIYTVKVDHALTSRQRVTVSYSQAGEKDADNRSFGAVGGSSHILQNTKYARVSHDYVISPTILNHFQYGFSRAHRTESPTYLGDYPEQIGLRNVGTGQFPYFVMPGYHFFGGDSTTFTVRFIPVNNAYQWNDALTLVKGKHSVKIGMEIRQTQYNAVSLGGHSGSLNFSTNQTGLPGSTARTGDTFASFLLGVPASAGYNPFGSYAARRFTAMGFFIQDDFKASRNLTLNLGLRYERFWPLSDATGRISTFDPNTPNPGAGGIPGALIFAGEGPGRTGSNRFQNIYNKAFGPRLGFAYQWNDRAVIRAGYGIYYQDPKHTGWGGANEGFFTNVTFVPPDDFSPAFIMGNGFPTDWPRPPFIDPAFANDRNVVYADPESGNPPISQNWQLSIQRQLSQSFLADVGYVATKGNHLVTGNQIYNQVDPKHLALGPLLSANINSPDAIAAGIVKPYPTYTGPVNQALRPFPQYRNINLRNVFSADKTGNSTYHSLQAKLQWRQGDGILLASYTFSKLLTDGSNNRDLDGFALRLGVTQNGFNRSAEKSVAALDLNHNFITSYLYALPFGPGKQHLTQGVASKILGGWTIGGILTYQSGWPIPSPLPATSRVPLFAGTIRPNREPEVEALTPAAKGDFDPGVSRYLNQAAWSSPAAFQFGNGPRMAGVRTKPFLNEDLSLLKLMSLSEKVKLQFRAETFNIFNRTQFGQPVLDLGSSDFGLVLTQSNKPRTMQFGLKIMF